MNRERAAKTRVISDRVWLSLAASCSGYRESGSEAPGMAHEILRAMARMAHYPRFHPKRPDLAECPQTTPAGLTPRFSHHAELRIRSRPFQVSTKAAWLPQGSSCTSSCERTGEPSIDRV